MEPKLYCKATVSTTRYADFIDLPEHKVVGMPNLSPTMETGTIIAWLKEEGKGRFIAVC